jgi:hypothetical protein
MEIFTERRIYMIVSFLFILGFLWWVNSLPDKFKKHNPELDALTDETKISIKRFTAAMNVAASLIEVSNERAVAACQGINVRKFTRMRQRSMPLRSGIRILKNRAEHVRASKQSL